MVKSGVSEPKFVALLTCPSAFPSCHPLWNASLKKEGIADFGIKLVAMATSLDQSRNQYQTEHLHQHVYHPGNLVKIGLVVFWSVSSEHLGFLWSPYVIGQTIIFLPCDFYLFSSSFFFHRLISAMVWPKCEFKTQV